MRRIPRRPGYVESDDPTRLTLEELLLLEQAPKLPPGDPRRRVNWADVAGKVWNAPNTALGLAYGLAGYGLGQVNRLRPGEQRDPRIQVGHNAVEFVNNPLGGASAITLGNTTTYRTDPYAPNDEYANGYRNEFGHDVQEHEERHTYQGQQLGPFYLPSNILGGVAGLLFDREWHGPHNWNERGPESNPPRAWPPRRSR